MLNSIKHSEPLYIVLFVAGIIFFCFFYVSIIFNPNEAADNMRKYGGFIPGSGQAGIPPDYMNNMLTKITVVGGIYLSILCLIPGHHDLGHQAAASSADGNFIDAHFPRLASGGLSVTFLFRRHVAADRGGRGDGYDQPD